MEELNQKQKMFADEYVLTGNASQSYLKIFGGDIKCAESASSRLLRNVKVKDYISNLNKSLDAPKIASMAEVKEFWADTMRNEKADLKDRLKASEYIAKTNAAFVDNHNISGELLVNIIDDLVDEDLDDEESE